MIVSFKNQATEDIFNGRNTREARNLCSQTVWRIAFRKLDQPDSVDTLDELRIPPGNRLESFKGNLERLFRIRINDQYGICFRWIEDGPSEVEITDYHEGKKS
ncbi:MAG: type II toxin-antitoxin system RelE/ParE family toxin [bacterium]|jgi:proteic killer suppression protein